MKINNKYAHRAACKTIKVADGANKKASVKQKRHAFLFGCSEFSSVEYASGGLTGTEKSTAEERYERLSDIFNFVTLPFYWGRFEPVRGVPDTERLINAARLFKDKGLTLKGHPLCWHTVCAEWLMELPDDIILNTQLDRIERDVKRFAGLIDMWDVINEAVIMPVFDKYDNGVTRICKKYGTEKLCKMLFAAARESTPDSVLLINDFNTSEKYAQLIERLLNDGVQIDAIGIQSHMHQGYWGVEKTEEVLERFSKFNLPLHFTENTLVSGDIMPPEIIDLNDYKNDSWLSTPDGEERQAREAVLHYKTLFNHPLVQSITWWSFNDGLWLGAPSGLITKDSKPKPAYNELFKLIKGEWWLTEEEHITDENGEITVTGCLGDYEVICDKKVLEFSIH
ncbi:MAG: endo-1,4-beta-xylanase [Oscillospiraceae bacterium]|nr:endo-1,4-beta-xylanase [Oscillospiraceae bacterium]